MHLINKKTCISYSKLGTYNLLILKNPFRYFFRCWGQRHPWGRRGVDGAKFCLNSVFIDVTRTWITFVSFSRGNINKYECDIARLVYNQRHCFNYFCGKIRLIAPVWYISKAHNFDWTSVTWNICAPLLILSLLVWYFEISPNIFGWHILPKQN